MLGGVGVDMVLIGEEVLGSQVTDGSDSDVVEVVAGGGESGITIADSEGFIVDPMLSDLESGISSGELGMTGPYHPYLEQPQTPWVLVGNQTLPSIGLYASSKFKAGELWPQPSRTCTGVPASPHQSHQSNRVLV